MSNSDNIIDFLAHKRNNEDDTFFGNHLEIGGVIHYIYEPEPGDLRIIQASPNMLPDNWLGMYYCDWDTQIANRLRLRGCAFVHLTTEAGTINMDIVARASVINGCYCTYISITSFSPASDEDIRYPEITIRTISDTGGDTRLLKSIVDNIQVTTLVKRLTPFNRYSPFPTPKQFLHGLRQGLQLIDQSHYPAVTFGSHK